MSEENNVIEEEAAQANMQYTVSGVDPGDVFLLKEDIAYVVTEKTTIVDESTRVPLVKLTHSEKFGWNYVHDTNEEYRFLTIVCTYSPELSETLGKQYRK